MQHHDRWPAHARYAPGYTIRTPSATIPVFPSPYVLASHAAHAAKLPERYVMVPPTPKSPRHKTHLPKKRVRFQVGFLSCILPKMKYYEGQSLSVSDFSGDSMS